MYGVCILIIFFSCLDSDGSRCQSTSCPSASHKGSRCQTTLRMAGVAGQKEHKQQNHSKVQGKTCGGRSHSESNSETNAEREIQSGGRGRSLKGAILVSAK